MKTISVFSSKQINVIPEHVDMAIELIHSNISLKNVFRLITYEDHGTRSLVDAIWRKAMDKRFPIGLVRFTPSWRNMDGGKAFYPSDQDYRKLVSQVSDLSEFCFAFVLENINEIIYLDLIRKEFKEKEKELVIFSIKNLSII